MKADLQPKGPVMSMSRWFHLAVVVWLAGVVLPSAQASDETPPFESLEAFCLASGIDTPENCRCGQETADKLLSPEEQKRLLAVMLDGDAMMRLAKSNPGLMDKLAQVTKGCQS